MKMKIKKQENNVTILTAEENLIGNNNTVLNDELNTLIENGDLNIVLNLSSVSQIDSYALGVLSSNGNIIKGKGGALKFAELQTFVQTLFNMMRMNDIFEIYDTIDEAVDSFNKE